MNNPADIYYNQSDNILAVPNSGNNTVDFVPYSPFYEPIALSWWCDNNTNIIEENKNLQIIKIIDLLGR